jgi:hypothetical protein
MAESLLEAKPSSVSEQVKQQAEVVTNPMDEESAQSEKDLDVLIPFLVKLCHSLHLYGVNFSDIF